MNTRNTKQRDIVYQAVVDNMNHPTAQQIYEDVKKKDPSISKSTVYRNLDILYSLGKINKFKILNMEHYDFTLCNHSHIICKKCGKVIDAYFDYNEEQDKQIALKTGFEIERHQIVFEGICPDCLQMTKKGA